MERARFVNLIRSAAVLAALMLGAGLAPLGHGAIDLGDECRRDYRIVVVDEDGADNSRRRFFESDKYTAWLCKADYQGREALVLKREEVTPDGHKINWDFIMNTRDLSLIRVDKKIVTSTGKVLKEESDIYENHFYKYPARTYHVNTLFVGLQYMDLKPGARKDAYLLVSPEVPPWKVTVVVEEEERITVPAGSFDTLKIKLEFDYEDMLGGRWARAMSLMSSLLPDYNYWVEKDSPHRMIKFQGAMGPPGTPLKAIELVKVHAEE